jgi:hypothetical protein
MKRSTEPRRSIVESRKGRFEMRACSVCGEVVAHGWVNGEPHGLHVAGAAHEQARLRRLAALEADMRAEGVTVPRVP